VLPGIRIRARGWTVAVLAAALIAVLPAGGATAAAKPQKPKAFRSCGDWVRYARAQALDIARPLGLATQPGSTSQMVPFSQPDGVRGGDGSGESAAPVAGQDFSTTNVQEEGVDEPDLVKTNGSVAYVAEDDGHLRSLDVSGGGAPRPLDTLEFDGYAPELLLHGDKLIVISGPGDEAADGVGTVIREVDVSNPAAMHVTRIMQVEGWYVGGRMTGGIARIVVHTEPEIDVPPGPPEVPFDADAAEQRVEAAVKRAKIGTWRPAYKLVNRRTHKRSWRALVDCRSVRKPAEFAGVGTTTVLTINVDQGLPAVDADALFADADTVYASDDSLYTATERWDESDDPNAKSATTIHEFAAPATPETSYRATGAVDGYLLSQWSLSEYEGVLRAVTTTEAPWESEDGAESTNAVYTLKPDDAGTLREIGRIDGLGKGQVVYAVRFIGPTGYVVTFRQVDPLHIIDASDPTKPHVAGELEIPGYSAYLHPVGDGLLLGVGQDADSRGRVKGTALSLFDVSDPARPRLLQKHTLEGDNYSEVEWDHRGFLYWPATKTAVIPVEAYSENENDEFIGAVGYRVDPEAGIEPIGRLQHGKGYDAGWLSRTFVVGSTLYSVSDTGMGANALDTFGPIGFVSFEPPGGDDDE
jgi:uncharacterized secreted protein with C-terminal beta-propeller domain